MPPIERSQAEIDDAINAADEHINEGVAQWPGMSYEQGVSNALRWATGESDDNPMED